MQNRVIMPIKDELTTTQRDFLRLCSELRYGTLEVKVKDGEPVMSKIIEQWHKHDA